MGDRRRCPRAWAMCTLRPRPHLERMAGRSSALGLLLSAHSLRQAARRGRRRAIETRQVEKLDRALWRASAAQSRRHPGTTDRQAVGGVHGGVVRRFRTRPEGQCRTVANPAQDGSTKRRTPDERRCRSKGELLAGGALLGLSARRSRGLVPGRRRSGARGSASIVLISERLEARAAKDFARADAIRAELTGLDIEVMDSSAGATWRLKERA